MRYIRFLSYMSLENGFLMISYPFKLIVNKVLLEISTNVI